MYKIRKTAGTMENDGQWPEWSDKDLHKMGWKPITD